MTCDEMRELATTKSPATATTSEVVAFVQHRLSCAGCRQWLTDKGKAAREQIGPKLAAVRELIADESSEQHRERARADPELSEKLTEIQRKALEITCDQFAQIIDDSMNLIRLKTMVQIALHYRQCTKCARTLQQQAEEASRAITPERREQIGKCGRQVAEGLYFQSAIEGSADDIRRILFGTRPDGGEVR